MATTPLWFCGFEAGGPIPNDTTGVAGESSAMSNGGGGSPSVVTTTPRTGNYCGQIPVSGIIRFGRWSHASSATRFIRFGFWIAANPSNPVVIFGSNSAANSPTSRGFHVWLNTNGTVGWAYDLSETGPVASGANAVKLGAWNLIEVKMLRDAAAGGMEIFLNGVLQVSQFDRGTTTNTSLTSVTMYFGNDIFQGTVVGVGPSNQTMLFDDIAFATAGYVGDGGSIAIQGKTGTPTYNAWTKNGAADAFGAWSQTPFDTTKNCTDSVVADRQTMLLDTADAAARIPSGSVINGAFVAAVGIIVTGGTFKLTHRIGGVDTDTGTKSLNTVVRQFEPNLLNLETFEVFLPSRADLTTGSPEIGCVSNSTNQATIDDVWLLVDFLAPASPSLNRDESLPVEWLTSIKRDELLLVDASSPANLIRRDELLPVELFSNNFFIVRDEKLPVEFTGGPQGSLLLIWNVREKLFAPFVLQWNVISRGLVQTFQLKWNVRSNLAYLVPFVLRWNVIPNLVTTLINDDIQLPTLTITKTP